MQEFLKIIESIFNSSNISETVSILILVAIILMGTIVGLIRLVKAGKAAFGAELQDRVTRYDLNAVKADIKDDTDNIGKQIVDIESKIIVIEDKCDVIIIKEDIVIGHIKTIQNLLDEIKQLKIEDSGLILPIGNELNRSSAEAQTRYNELYNQIHTIQKDLAALQGTIIGMGTTRRHLR